MEEGEFYAIETFGSTGEGYVRSLSMMMMIITLFLCFVLFYVLKIALVLFVARKYPQSCKNFGHTQAAMCEFPFRGAMKLAKSNEEFFFHDFAWFCPYITFFQSHSTLHISVAHTGRRESQYMQSLLALEHLSFSAC